MWEIWSVFCFITVMDEECGMQLWCKSHCTFAAAIRGLKGTYCILKDRGVCRYAFKGLDILQYFSSLDQGPNSKYLCLDVINYWKRSSAAKNERDGRIKKIKSSGAKTLKTSFSWAIFSSHITDNKICHVSVSFDRHFVGYLPVFKINKFMTDWQIGDVV